MAITASSSSTRHNRIETEGIEFHLSEKYIYIRVFLSSSNAYATHLAKAITINHESYRRYPYLVRNNWIYVHNKDALHAPGPEPQNRVRAPLKIDDVLSFNRVLYDIRTLCGNGWFSVCVFVFGVNIYQNVFKINLQCTNIFKKHKLIHRVQ